MVKTMQAPVNEPEWRDLRGWLDLVDALGELKHVRGANSEEDIGAITDMLDHADESCCVLFDEIPNYQRGYRVLVNSMGSRRRQAVTLGLDPAAASHEQLLDFWRKLLKGFAPLPPVVVRRGPVQENILRDSEVDLNRFPAPIWHPGDGGRFIGTASVNIMRDPDTGIINAGTYRNQVFDRNGIGIRVAPPHDGGIIKEKYMKRGKPCPIVTVVGSDPLLFLAACVQGPSYGDSELDWAGGVRGCPIEVIEGEITGLPIPAHAEIALEGFITTDEFAKEGPYGEWMGYYSDDVVPRPYLNVKTVMYRNNPILTCAPQHKPVDETGLLKGIAGAAEIWKALEACGLPEILGVWNHEGAPATRFTVIQIRQRYPGHARNGLHVAANCMAGAYNGKWTVVVDDDVANAEIL
jgi:UbiD family decarboxylase